MIRTIEAWQCIGCGKIEAPQTCIGVCQDRKIVMVGIDDHQQALATAGALRNQLRQAQALLSRLALSTPRDGQWEQSYRALQQQARSLLESPPGSSASLASDGKESGQ
jgi:hypothetical protein